MKIAVCVKQIPDPATRYALDPETHFLVRPAEQHRYKQLCFELAAERDCLRHRKPSALAERDEQHVRRP